jgi:hypothetical protein
MTKVRWRTSPSFPSLIVYTNNKTICFIAIARNLYIVKHLLRSVTVFQFYLIFRTIQLQHQLCMSTCDISRIDLVNEKNTMYVLRIVVNKGDKLIVLRCHDRFRPFWRVSSDDFYVRTWLKIHRSYRILVFN